MTGLDAVAERVSRGEALTDDDARAVLASADIIAIGIMADDLRRQKHGSGVTFVRVFEFHVDAPPASLPAGAVAGEVRIVGSPSTAHSALMAVRVGRTLAAGPLTGFSLADLAAIASSAGGLEDFCAQLDDAGLDAVADVAIDRLDSTAPAIAAARRGGLSVMRLTVHSLQPEQRIDMIRMAHEIQEAVGGIRAFAPLPRAIPASNPTTGYDDVKQVALARLLAPNIDSIQVDWSLYGPKLAQVSLTVGADDIDGVAAVEPGTLGPRRTALEEIRGNILAAGLEPVERDGLFGPLRG